MQQRGASKSVGLAAAMRDVLATRGVPAVAARLAAEMCLLAFKQGFAEWLEADSDPAGVKSYALAALDELRATAQTLG